MPDRFDELAKALASGLTRRDALRRFAGGLIGWLLADAALGSKAEAQAPGTCPDYCRSIGIEPGGGNAFGKCVSNCAKCREGGGTACGASGCCHGTETCSNGVCKSPCANPGTCGNLSLGCDSDPACICFLTTEGTGFCHRSQACAGSQACTSTADCPAGFACSNVTCCGATGICIRPCIGTLAATGDGPTTTKR